MDRHARQPAPAPPGTAFTLIELLVVIMIIGVLMSIALPVLAKARRSGVQVRESVALKQVCVGYTVYAQDNRSALLPGFLPLDWVTPGADPAREFKVFYADTGGQPRLYGSAARRYPWRLAPYLGYALDAIVTDKRLRAEFGALPDRPDTLDGYQWAFASSPSFGLNSTYVGGDARRGAFHQPSLARWGKFYVTKIEDARLPDRLIIFTTSRGHHPISGSGVVLDRCHRSDQPRTWRSTKRRG